MRLSHLVRRFIGSVVSRPLTDSESRVVRVLLLPQEHELFSQLSRADKRHALHVLRRFDSAVPTAAIDARRAALLHDIGKVGLRLGVLARVIATIVGPRTSKFADYHHHESRGAELLERVGSSRTTVDLLRGSGDAGIVAALRSADEI